MFNTLYKKCLNLAAHKSSKYYLGLVSFIESSFFPIPPDIMIIPMVISKKTDFLQRKVLIDLLHSNIHNQKTFLFNIAYHYYLTTNGGENPIELLTRENIIDDYYREVNAMIISDGGICYPGDVSKAYGAGADFVMIGSMFAGHTECPGEIIEEEGKKYKLFYKVITDPYCFLTTL